MKTWKVLVVASALLAGLLFVRARVVDSKEAGPPRPAAVPSDWVSVGSEYAINWGSARIVVLCDSITGFVYYSEVGVMFPPGHFSINAGNDLFIELYCTDGNIWVPERITNPKGHPGQDYPPDPPWLWPPEWFIRPTPLPLQPEGEVNI